MPQPRQMTARKAMRMRQFDYSSQGAYFVTIVTNNRLNLFGRVEDEEMKQNEAGTMVAKEYEALEQLFEGMGCLDYVVMPNHFHCLIYLDKDKGITLPEIIAHFKSGHACRKMVSIIYAVMRDNKAYTPCIPNEISA